MSQIQLDLESYLHTLPQLRQAVEGLTAEQLHWKEQAGKWSVAEVITHLADHHIVVAFRIRDILAGTTERLPACNQDRWVTGQYANEGKVEESFALIGALLRYNSLLFQRLRAEDWQQSGINSLGASVTIRQIISSFTEHVHRHLAQIDRIKSAYALGLAAEGQR